MSDAPISCRELIEFLAAYLDGELARDERSAFETHLALCPPCVDYLRGYEESIRLGKAALASESEPPDPIPEELVTAILAARRRPGPTGDGVH